MTIEQVLAELRTLSGNRAVYLSHNANYGALASSARVYWHVSMFDNGAHIEFTAESPEDLIAQFRARTNVGQLIAQVQAAAEARAA